MKPSKHIKSAIESAVTDACNRVGEAILSLRGEIIESLSGGDSQFCIYRPNGKTVPVVSFSLYASGSEEILTNTCTFDEFLDEIEEVYSGCEEGWGIDMIDDLKLLKSKIDERILKMERCIAEESE